jgi:hypothetical protein
MINKIELITKDYDTRTIERAINVLIEEVNKLTEKINKQQAKDKK